MGKELPLPKPVNAFLHSFSQVVFIENNISGFLIMLAFFMAGLFNLRAGTWHFSEFAGWNQGIIVIVAAIVGNVTAYAMGLDKDTITAGLFGFSPVLVGIGAAFFFGAGIEAYFVAILGSILVVPVTVVINNLFGRLGLPGFTLPFMVVTWLFVLVGFKAGFLNLLPGADGSMRSAALLVETPAEAALGFSKMFDSLIWEEVLTNGFGEIYLLDSVVASVIIFIAFLVDRWQNAVALVGVILSTIVIALVLQVNVDSLNLGLYSYNAILVYMGLVTFSTNKGKNHGKFWTLVAIGMVLVVLADCAVPAIMGTFGLTSLTFPFAIVTWALLYFEQRVWGDKALDA